MPESLDSSNNPLTGRKYDYHRYYYPYRCLPVTGDAGPSSARQGRRHGRSLRQRLIWQPVGATGSANFLSRATGFCATIFLLCTLGLAFYSRAGVESESGGVMEAIQASPVEGTATPAETKPAEPKTPVQDIPK